MKNKLGISELDTEPFEEIRSVSVAVSTPDFLSGITDSNSVPNAN